jgi:hypothetical protein
LFELKKDHGVAASEWSGTEIGGVTAMPVKLKTLYEKQEEIPEGFGELFTEKNGKFELTAVEGVKTQADIDRVQQALVKERADHKAVKDKLVAFGDVDPATIPVLQEELAEANSQLAAVTAEGKDKIEAVQAQIDAAINRAVGPVTRDKDALARQLEATKKTVAERDTEIASVKQEQQQERVRNTLRDAVIAAKVVPTAIDDAVLVGERMFELVDGKLVTKADNGLTPGLNPKEWAKDMEEKRPHWFEKSVGGGAQGGKGGGTSVKDNPWSEAGWNLTKQGQVVKDIGPEKAADMAARVGSKLGATKATKKAA